MGARTPRSVASIGILAGNRCKHQNGSLNEFNEGTVCRGAAWPNEKNKGRRNTSKLTTEEAMTTLTLEGIKEISTTAT